MATIKTDRFADNLTPLTTQRVPPAVYDVYNINDIIKKALSHNCQAGFFSAEWIGDIQHTPPQPTDKYPYPVNLNSKSIIIFCAYDNNNNILTINRNIPKIDAPTPPFGPESI